MVADRRWDRRYEINAFAVYFVDFLNSHELFSQLFDINLITYKDLIVSLNIIKEAYFLS